MVGNSHTSQAGRGDSVSKCPPLCSRVPTRFITLIGGAAVRGPRRRDRMNCAPITSLPKSAIEVFVGHAFERPMDLSELSRNLEMPRDTVRRRLQRLIEIGLVERIDHRYYMTPKMNAPLQREVLLAHLHNLQAAIKEVSEMNTFLNRNS